MSGYEIILLQYKYKRSSGSLLKLADQHNNFEIEILLTDCEFRNNLFDSSIRLFFRNKVETKCIEDRFIFKITKFSIRFFLKLYRSDENTSKCTTSTISKILSLYIADHHLPDRKHCLLQAIKSIH